MKAGATLGRAADIAASAKRASTAGDDQYANIVRLPREIDRRAHLLDHRLVVSIHPLGAVDCDFRDLVARIVDDRREVHFDPSPIKGVRPRLVRRKNQR